MGRSGLNSNEFVKHTFTMPVPPNPQEAGKYIFANAV